MFALVPPLENRSGAVLEKAGFAVPRTLTKETWHFPGGRPLPAAAFSPSDDPGEEEEEDEAEEGEEGSGREGSFQSGHTPLTNTN